MKRLLIPLVASAVIMAGCSPAEKLKTQAKNEGAPAMQTTEPVSSDPGSSEVSPLKVGDAAPDLALDGNSYNWKGDMPKMADFKGKVVVLDYWAYW